MKSLFFKFIIFFIILAVTGPFLLKDHNGRPLMSLDKLKMPQLATPSMDGVKDIYHEITDQNDRQTADKVIAYKWQDENGVWHFSDKDNNQNTGEQMEITPMNTLHYQQPKNINTLAANDSSHQQNDPLSSINTAPSSNPLERIQQTVELAGQANKIEKKLQTRHDNQLKAIDN